MITIDKINIVQDKIKKALAQIEKEENVKIDFGTRTYTAAFYKTRMTVKTTEKNEEVSFADEATCKRLGFTQNVIGMKFNTPKGIYEVINIKTQNRKYPVIAKAPNGTTYKYSVSQIKALVGGDKIINRTGNLDKLLK